MAIIEGIVALLVIAGGIYLVYTKLMVPNGDGNMPSDLANQVKANAVDAANDAAKKL